jgi:hypothetical protein
MYLTHMNIVKSVVTLRHSAQDGDSMRQLRDFKGRFVSPKTHVEVWVEGEYEHDDGTMIRGDWCFAILDWRGMSRYCYQGNEDCLSCELSSYGFTVDTAEVIA